MSAPGKHGRRLEIAIGLVTLVLSTAALLLSAYALAVLALVTGGVSFGILIGSRSAPDP
jgi:hypothetical protein